MIDYLKYKNWYNLTFKTLKRKYKHDYKLIAGLIASTSPRFSIKRNIKTALKLYEDFKNNQDVFINNILNNKDNFLRHYKIFKHHYNNILKTLKHDYKKDLNLNGLKVNAFYHNLIGNTEYITLDIWMLKYFNHKTKWINKSDYLKYSSIIKEMALKEGLRPSELQAIIWIKTRLEHGFKPVNFYKFIK